MKYLTFILIALLAACGLHFETRISAEDASASVYKIAGSTTLTLLDADGKIVEGVKPIPAGWSGTGWVIERGKGVSYLMTAGHVCETDSIYTDIDFWTGEDVKFAIDATKYTFINTDGVEFTGSIVLKDDDVNDLCILAIAGDFGTPLPLATEDPPYSATGYYIGAPMGLWGGGIAGYYETHFSGRGKPWSGRPEALVFSTASAAPGASGSPYIYDGQVVALLNLGLGQFMTFSSGVPHEVILKFWREARHLSSKD